MPNAAITEMSSESRLSFFKLMIVAGQLQREIEVVAHATHRALWVACERDGQNDMDARSWFFKIIARYLKCKVKKVVKAFILADSLKVCRTCPRF